jgi:hypothetical protein
MSEKNEPIWNIVKILFATFVLLLVWNSAFGQTTTVRLFVNGEPSPFPVVSITETPHMVKVTIKNNETGEVIEGQVSTEEQTEEEPDCE